MRDWPGSDAACCLGPFRICSKGSQEPLFPQVQVTVLWRKVWFAGARAEIAHVLLVILAVGGEVTTSKSDHEAVEMEPRRGWNHDPFLGVGTRDQ